MKQMIFFFDLDGTITKKEILPEIAKFLDIEEEIALLTKITMDGFLDFSQSFKLRILLLKELFKDQKKIKEICDKIPLNNLIIDFIEKNSSSCYIITGAVRDYIDPLLQQIPCNAFTSTGSFTPDGQYKLEKILIKGEPVRQIKKTTNTITVAIGDGSNDLPLFEETDIRIAYGGVHKPMSLLLDLADYSVYKEESLCLLLNML